MRGEKGSEYIIIIGIVTVSQLYKEWGLISMYKTTIGWVYNKFGVIIKEMISL